MANRSHHSNGRAGTRKRAGLASFPTGPATPCARGSSRELIDVDVGKYKKDDAENHDETR